MVSGGVYRKVDAACGILGGRIFCIFFGCFLGIFLVIIFPVVNLVNLFYGKKIRNGKIALSSGQEKKIQIIRGLLSDTPVLLLDEPLTCLDNNSQILLQKYIEEHSENKITIIIFHNPFVGMIGRKIIINNKSLFIK